MNFLKNFNKKNIKKENNQEIISEKTKEELKEEIVDFRINHNFQIEDIELGKFYDLSILKNINFEKQNSNKDIFAGYYIYSKFDFDTSNFINKSNMTGIEIGGPTEEDYIFFDIKFNFNNKMVEFKSFSLLKEFKKRNKIFISNILDRVYWIDDYNDDKIEITSSEKVNFRTDAFSLPIKDEKLDIIFASALGIPSMKAIEILKKLGLVFQMNF